MTNSLINKYRPTRFADVLGQDAVCRSFAKAIKDGSSHAFLLSGPSGTGKTTLARIAIKEAGCSEITEVDGATFTGIDEMRQLTQALNYAPFGGGKRALLINEAHGLSKQAWDSILTKVEEPPSWVLWIFTTTLIDKVPAAIKTRTTKYDLKLVDRQELEDLLLSIAEHEHMACDNAVVALCAKHAEGSPRAAIAALAACQSARSKDEALELLRSALESAEAIDLARTLMDKAPSWLKIKEILALLKDQNPEGVRHVVRAYATSVILGAKGEPSQKAMAILEAFSQPFLSGDGQSPLVLACCKLLFA